VSSKMSGLMRDNLSGEYKYMNDSCSSSNFIVVKMRCLERASHIFIVKDYKMYAKHWWGNV
jgi:hypothetical protein